MSRQRKIRVIATNGTEVSFDPRDVQKIVMPSVLVENKFRRLVVNLQEDVVRQVQALKKEVQ